MNHAASIVVRLYSQQSTAVSYCLLHVIHKNTNVGQADNVWKFRRVAPISFL